MGIGAKDAAGNVAVGDVLLEGADDCYVRCDGIVTAVVGLEDAVVVVTEDAVLAMHRDRAQDVKPRGGPAARVGAARGGSL